MLVAVIAPAVASFRFYAPTLQQQGVRSRPVLAALPEMQDDLKPKFSRGNEEVKTSFTPDTVRRAEERAAAAKEQTAADKNQQLLAKSGRFKPEKPAAEPVKDKAIDLNGIQPFSC